MGLNYVYLLRCADGSLYCGWTTDPEARVAAHNSGRGAKYTRSRLPVKLVYMEAYEDRHEALSREWHIKRMKHEAKEKLTCNKNKRRIGIMKRTMCGILSLSLLLLGCGSALAEGGSGEHRLLYQGHGSLRIVTAEGKVIYVDPYAGEGYDLPADLILITHGHQDHTAVKLIKKRNEGCQVITWKEALVKGEYKTFDLGFATVEAVQAGNNRNHNIKECVGWVITLSGGMTVYATGDTSTTEQMAELAERNIDYAFFVCDGKYNMDMDEAIACAKLVNAKHSIPYHMAPGKLFDQKRAEKFDAPNRLIIPAGEEIVLE